MNAKKVNFIIGIHCHQPVGNFGWVIDEAYEKSYLPFIEVLDRHPGIKISLHLSGGLLKWIHENKPGYFVRLRRLIDRKQIELLGGGFYEPILTLIPEEDRLAQLSLLRDFIKRHFKFEVKGAWLSERVWEPQLVSTFNKSGIQYTIVDDAHFRLAGKTLDEIFGYYVTEEDSKELYIFPTSQKLRYMIPFKLPQDTIEYLRSLQSDEGRAIVVADDGEKFGFWPGTYKWVYEENYLENFFRLLEDNSSWLNVMTFSEFIESFRPLDRIYLPCASYSEMMSWSQGYFKNFLIKYPESNTLHKKMLYTSRRIREFERKPEGRKAGKSLDAAKRFLYMGQCNDAYWHGVFGGLYLNHLREAAFGSLIESEKVTDGLLYKKKDWLRVDVFDFDKDGYDDIILNTPVLAVYINPKSGGTIFELDIKRKSLNLINTLTRRFEQYHNKIEPTQGNRNSDKPQDSHSISSIHDIVGFKEDNLRAYLNYDGYRKAALIDHFLEKDETVERFSKGTFLEKGDFIEKPFSFEIKKASTSTDRKACTITLSREASVLSNNSEIPVILKKSVNLRSNLSAIDFRYEIQNASGQFLSVNFGVELNLSLKDPQFNEAGKIEDINNVAFNDMWHNLSIHCELAPKCTLWYFPIETISESEGGVERTYQGLSLMFIWRLEIEGNKKGLLSIKIDLKDDDSH
jgi:alpha-amylase